MQTIFPCFRYQDAPVAIDWLKNTFGFEEQLVIPGEGGLIDHAQLILDGHIIMLGSERDDSVDMRSAKSLGGCSSSSYIVVEEIDAHYARTQAAGAKIIRELTDTEYGSREYGVEDPEGHLWFFGTYQPHEPPQ